ncbi:hypothetical protein B566_EDAN001082 [Ephemera danica]|nr:hypothetical protein B566_EDAN001082 [Ephemera danica]
MLANFCALSLRSTLLNFRLESVFLYRRVARVEAPSITCITHWESLIMSDSETKTKRGRGRQQKSEPKKETKRKVAEKNDDIPAAKKAKASKGKPAEDKESKSTKKEGGSKTLLNKTESNFTTVDYEESQTTSDGKSFNLKIASWNAGGLRSLAKKGGFTYVEHEKPDIFCLQEIKCTEAQLPPEANLKDYHAYWASGGEGSKGGYAGVAVYSKVKPVNVKIGLGIAKHDEEGRVITAEYDKFYLVNAYVPNSGRGLVTLPKRLEWNKDFHQYLSDLDKKKPVILTGDLNVSHLEIDLARPKTNTRSAGFTQEERDGFSELLSRGFIDSFRELYPEKEGAYTYWTYMANARAKNVGWRLDYFVISKRLQDNLCDNIIRSNVYGSDHCPLVLTMHILRLETLISPV